VREDYTKVFVCDVNRRQILGFRIFLFRSLYVVTYKMRRRLRILVRILYVVCFRSSHFIHTLHGDCVYACGERGRHVGLIGLQAVDVVAVYRRSPPVSLPQKLIQERTCSRRGDNEYILFYLYFI